jgi:hypothetical protein
MHVLWYDMNWECSWIAVNKVITFNLLKYYIHVFYLIVPFYVVAYRQAVRITCGITTLPLRIQFISRKVLLTKLS